ncbi:MAG: hypothetical protein HQ568_08785, partial [Calditrichaeota bacterium]|nr:hypothetical protein [Calditrichota bacterium]
MKYKYPLLLMVFSIAAFTFAMPPHPDWLRKSDSQAQVELGEFFVDAHQRGVNSQGQSILETIHRLRRDDDDPIT